MADQPRVAFETSLGNFTIELAADKVPATVENFLQYVDDGFFDGTIFHRVISHFMIQGGGFTAINQPKREGLRPPIKNEATEGMLNKRGTISMARTHEPHSATSQFFISVEDNDMLDPNAQSAGYCAFGTVVEGMDVVDKIKSVPVKVSAMMGGEESEPVDPPVLQKATRAS